MSDTAVTREDVITKIKGIIENEKFKLDAYFLCGCPSDAPNNELKQACENYVEKAEKGEQSADDINAMISAMEASVQSESAASVVKSITSSGGSIKYVLENRAVL